MASRVLLACCLVAGLVGCDQSQSQMQMGPPKKPDPSPELSKLNMFVGHWTGTAEMVKPSMEEMKKSMPPGHDAPSSFAGGNKTEWVMGGMYLKSEGWYEMGPDQKANYVEYITWNPRDKKYHSIYMNDWGERGDGTMTLADDGKTFHGKWTGCKPDGTPMTGCGTVTFSDANTMTWNWRETGFFGQTLMEMKGTSRRSP